MPPDGRSCRYSASADNPKLRHDDCGALDRRRLETMLTQALTLGLVATGHRWLRRCLYSFAGVASPMRDALAVDVAPADGTLPQRRLSGRCRPPSATWFLVLGSPCDGKAFTSAIRAFALAGRLGDHLTLIGYGHERRSLEKWARALQVDGSVTFANPAIPDPLADVVYDVAMLVSCQADRSTMRLEVFGARSANGGNSTPSHWGSGETTAESIPCGDVLALSHAMLMARRNPVVPA